MVCDDVSGLASRKRAPHLPRNLPVETSFKILAEVSLATLRDFGSRI